MEELRAPTKRGLARRRAIIEAAEKLFLEHGFNGTTLDMIIEVAGGSRRTIYSAFDGKEGLFTGVMIMRSKRMQERFAEQQLEALPLPDYLRRTAQLFLEMILNPDSMKMYRNLVAVASQFPELGKAFYENGPAAFYASLASYLEKQAKRGVVQLRDPRISATQFLEMVKGDLQIRALFAPDILPDQEEIQRRISMAVDTWLIGHHYRSQH